MLVDLSSSAPRVPERPTSASEAEIATLREQLSVECARREAAEQVGDRATADLDASVKELHEVQSEILERADQDRVVNDLARQLRGETSVAALVEHGARALGRAVLVDRCRVLLHPSVPSSVSPAAEAIAEGFAVAGQEGLDESESAAWTRGGVDLPTPVPLASLPPELLRLLRDSARTHRTLQLDDVRDDPRLTASEGAGLAAVTGTGALLGVPIAVGRHAVGWVLLESVRPRRWRRREIAISEGLADDLGAMLLQVRGLDQQRSAVQRMIALDEAKDVFISSVSHELRTPLTSMTGYLEMIRDGELGEVASPVVEALAVVERNTVRLRSLVEDLLALSAYDTGQISLLHERVDLVDVVSRCYERAVGHAGGLDVVLEVLGEIPKVTGDGEQLEKIVDNLLSNAVKFTPRGGRVTVQLSLEERTGSAPGVPGARVESPGVPMVRISISDSGIGIPPAEQQGLFTRFFRSSNAVVGHYQGTGLGLALVHQVVTRHDGTVELRSAEGAGTTVLVRLPVR